MIRTTVLLLALFGALSMGTAVLADQPAGNPAAATLLPNATGHAAVVPVRRFVYYGYSGYVGPAYAYPSYGYYAPAPYYTYRPYIDPYYAPGAYDYTYYPYYSYGYGYYVPRRFYYSGPRVTIGF
jgi:hypothetical protein